MKRSDLYRAVARDIAAKAKNDRLIDDDEENSVNDNIVNYDSIGNLGSVDIFDDINKLGIYKEVAKVINLFDGTDNADIAFGSNIYFGNVEQKNEPNYVKDVCIYDSTNKFTVITSEMLYGVCRNPINTTQIRNIFESILGVLNNNAIDTTDFWNLCKNPVPQKFIIVTNTTLPIPLKQDDLWNLFSFGYLLYINGYAVTKHPDLDFDKSRKFKNSILYTSNKEYAQYYDVYNLIGESHYCDDVLSRYLNMYHILEYMVFRSHLVNLSKGSIRKNAFVRRTIEKMTRNNKSETDVIIDTLPKLFPNLSSMIGLDAAQKRTVQTFFDINISGSSDKKMAELIYKIRNSIAHNKATELHFGFGNIDEYHAMISVIRKIVEIMENRIIDLINNNNPNHPLEYEKREFLVY